MATGLFSMPFLCCRACWSGTRPPERVRTRLFASVLLGGVAFATVCPAAERHPSPTTCHLATFATGTVQSVIDGRSFTLADGREVRLDGIEVPAGTEALGALG